MVLSVPGPEIVGPYALTVSKLAAPVSFSVSPLARVTSVAEPVPANDPVTVSFVLIASVPPLTRKLAVVVVAVRVLVPPEKATVPAPEMLPPKLPPPKNAIVPDAATIDPVLVTVASIVLATVPPVFSSRPALLNVAVS